MDPNIQKQSDELWALLRANEKIAERNEARNKAAHERAMVRMDKFDQKLEATRKLVEMGMKMMVRLHQSQKATDAQIKATDAQIKATDAQLKALISFRSGGNGRSH
jgi:hypothetical protein